MADANSLRVVSSRGTGYLKIAVIVTILVALNVGGAWLTHQFNIQIFPRHEPMLHAFVLGTAVLYTLLMAIPFMPGIEIGLALMVMLGGKGAVLVYLCTLVALSISFTLGRATPVHWVYGLLNWLHLSRASKLVQQLEPLNQTQRLSLLTEKAPSRIAPFFLKHRYLAVAIAINLPGNALLGGGGGIGLIVGMSKLIPFHAYIVLLAIAIAPVPLAFYLQGI